MRPQLKLSFVAVLALLGMSGCSRHAPGVQPIVPIGDTAARGFTPMDLEREAREAIQDRLMRRERQFRELYEPGSLWNELRVEQRDIDAGRLALPQLANIGRELFLIDFGPAQGLGNGLAALKSPLAGNKPAPNLRHVQGGDFGGPDGTRCAGCHHVGGLGGGGFAIDNTFADGDGERPASGLERQPRALFGAAVLQRLGEEMSAELQAQARDAMRTLKTGESRKLTAKGIAFGTLRKTPSGKLDLLGVRGVSLDLIVRPFGWKGTSASLRQTVISSLQQNLGIQADELVRRSARGGALGNGPAEDPDADGVKHEATEGMVSAMTAFIASLTLPMEDLLLDGTFTMALGKGMQQFASLGCADCHVPELPLNGTVVRLGPTSESQPVVDVAPLLATAPGQPHRVRLYSDLRRHNMGDELSETRGYLGIPKQVWLTPPLWGLSATGPYLHDGRAGDIDHAIKAHGGEAEASRKAYASLSMVDGAPLRLFLLTLTRPTKLEFRP